MSLKFDTMHSDWTASRGLLPSGGGANLLMVNNTNSDVRSACMQTSVINLKLCCVTSLLSLFLSLSVSVTLARPASAGSALLNLDFFGPVEDSGSCSSASIPGQQQP